VTIERWSIPDRWVWCIGADVARIVGGGTPSTKVLGNFAEDGVPWIGPADLTNYRKTYIGRGRRDLSDLGYAKSGATMLPAGSVLFSSRAPIGYCAIAANPLCTNQGFKSWICENGISPEFVRHYLRASVDYADSLASGTTFREVSTRRVESMAFPLPPAAEQGRIVAKLDALTSRIDRARAELDRVPVLAEQLRKQVVREAFHGTLTADWRISNGNSEITVDALNEAYLRQVGSERRKPPAEIEWRPSFDVPPSWQWVSIDQIVTQVQYGSSAKTSSDANGVPVLRMGNIQGGKLDWTDLKYLPKDHNEFPDLLLNEGDLLFNRTNSFELVGKTAVCKNLDKPVSFASYLIRIRPFGILAELLSAYLNSPLARSWVERVASQQVGQANVNGSKLKALGIPLPPFDEQAEILQRLNAAFARADRLEAEAVRARALLNRLEAAILAKAYRGELVPQDKNDEPASVLLDRIRAQRDAAPKAKRGRRATR
jgi:type I restriction enzyme, S subunit